MNRWIKDNIMKWKDDGEVNLKWNQFNQLFQGYLTNLKQNYFGAVY